VPKRACLASGSRETTSSARPPLLCIQAGWMTVDPTCLPRQHAPGSVGLGAGAPRSPLQSGFPDPAGENAPCQFCGSPAKGACTAPQQGAEGEHRYLCPHSGASAAKRKACHDGSDFCRCFRCCTYLRYWHPGEPPPPPKRKQKGKGKRKRKRKKERKREPFALERRAAEPRKCNPPPPNPTLRSTSCTRAWGGDWTCIYISTWRSNIYRH